MRIAMELAGRGHYTTAPNPMVGCVIVNAEEQIIGQGWHQAYGGPHAEVEAFESVSTEDAKKLSESTWYVTLEPCNHEGKTPACAALIERIRPKRVVLGAMDTNPTVKGGGMERLSRAGIQVEAACLANELAWQNRRFFWNSTRRRPWVVLKWAESRDGFIDGRPEKHRTPGAGGFAITSEAARSLTHEWRALEAGIVVGAGTVLIDEPQLNVRSIEAPSPRIVVLDPYNRIDSDNPLFKRNPDAIHVMGDAAHPSAANPCRWELDEGLDTLLERLYSQFGLSSLLVEGGATVLNDFLNQGVWNEVKRWKSPQSTGGGLPAPPWPEHAVNLPFNRSSSGQLGADAWENCVHPRHVFD